VSETLDEAGSGATSSMQIAQGTLWISYADETRGGLKVAHRALSDPSMSVVSPTSELIDGAANIAKAKNQGAVK